MRPCLTTLALILCLSFAACAGLGDAVTGLAPVTDAELQATLEARDAANANATKAAAEGNLPVVLTSTISGIVLSILGGVGLSKRRRIKRDLDDAKKRDVSKALDTIV